MSIAVLSVAPDGTDGTWLDSVGQVMNWQHVATFPGGDTSATFDLVAAPNFADPSVTVGRRIFAKEGSALIWAGRLDVVEKGQPWRMSCVGIAALAKWSVNNTAGTPTLNTIVDAAITNGLPWTRPASLTNPKAPITRWATLDDTLTGMVADSQFWAVTSAGVVSTPAALPTTPSLLMFVPTMPNRTMETYANVGIVTYNTTATVTVLGSATEIAQRGRIETAITLDPAVTFTSTTAAAAGAAKLVDLQARTWTAPLVTSQGSLFDIGGTAIDVATVRPGQVVRVITLQYPDDLGTASIDITIGQVDYDDATGTITLTPRNVASNTFDKVLERIAHVKNLAW